jgi:hypothetical protein
MHVTTRATTPVRRSRAAIALVGVVLLVAGCSGPAAAPRPTDPMVIVREAIGRTASLPSVRFAGEVRMSMVDAATGEATFSVEADVNLATRELAGRQSTHYPPEFVGGGVGTDQVSEFVISRAGAFSKDAATGRWSNMGSMDLPASPTNGDVGLVVAGLVADPAVRLELVDAADCSLGRCDHVVAHVNGVGIGATIGRLMGIPPDAFLGVPLPDFDLHILVDQATSLISDLQVNVTMQGSQLQLRASFTRPGEPVAIAPPPAGLIDGNAPPILEPAATPVPELPPAGTESPLPADSP